MVSEGYTNKEIGEALNINPKTIYKRQEDLINKNCLKSPRGQKKKAYILFDQGLKEEEVSDKLGLTMKTTHSHWLDWRSDRQIAKLKRSSSRKPKEPGNKRITASGVVFSRSTNIYSIWIE